MLEEQQVFQENISGLNLEIYTLGQFEVKENGIPIFQKTMNSSKIWELFNYMLINREKRIHPDSIIQDLWPSQEYTDPKSAVHSLIYRMRCMLGKNRCLQNYISIYFYQGCYIFSLNETSWVDFVEFERLSSKASNLKDTEPERALDLFNKALSLYKGSFLPEHPYKEWLTPARHYYRRLYTKNIIDLIELLRRKQDFSQIHCICESIFAIDPLIEVEKIHVYFMEALVMDGRKGDALSHYEFVNSLLKQELEATASEYLTDYYMEIKNSSSNSLSNSYSNSYGSQNNIMKDLDQLNTELAKRNSKKGTFKSDWQVFQEIYKLEVRKSERTGIFPIILLLTIMEQDYSLPGKDKLARAGSILKDILINNLRKGDVMCELNKSQFVVMLPGMDTHVNQVILNRIQKKFSRQFKDNKLVLVGQFQQVFP